MADYYPPVAFSFEVRVTGIDGDIDAGFSEVSGLSTERAVVEIREGGENRFTHRAPGIASQPNLVLRRGLMAAPSALFDWCRETLESDFTQPIAPRDVTISLLDENGKPVMMWNAVAAWPVKWEIAPFNATENSVATETLEFAYARLERAPVRMLPLLGMLAGEGATR